MNPVMFDSINTHFPVQSRRRGVQVPTNFHSLWPELLNLEADLNYGQNLSEHQQDFGGLQLLDRITRSR